jgi:hypothetical protein
MIIFTKHNYSNLDQLIVVLAILHVLTHLISAYAQESQIGSDIMKHRHMVSNRSK